MTLHIDVNNDTGNREHTNYRDHVLHALHAVLESENSLSRCCAVRGLGRLQAGDEVSGTRLVELLRDPDADVRADAASALGQLEFEPAVGPLVENLENDPEGDVRIQVVTALSRIRSEAVVDPLIRCFLEDGYPHLGLVVDDLEYNACWEVQSRALEALAKIGDQRAVEPLMEVLQEIGYEDLQDIGYRALAQLNSNKAKQFLLQQLQQGEPLARRRAALALSSLAESNAVCQQIPADIQVTLTNALVDSEASVRQYAARALANSDNPLVVVPLILLLTDSNLEVRSEVAEILGKMHSKELLDRLLPMLEEPEIETKRVVARILGEIGDAAAVEPLSRLLEVQHSDLLYDVVAALGRIGISGPQNKLAALLANGSFHYAIRIEAARALGSILKTIGQADGTADGESRLTADTTAGSELSPKQILIEAVFDNDQRISYAALDSLVDIEPDEASTRLIELLRENRPATGDDDPAAVKLSAVGDAETDSKSNLLCRQLNDAEDENVSEPLHDLVKGHDASTSTLAAILSAQSRLKPGTPSIPENADKEQPPVDNSLRILAVRLLGGIARPGSRAVDALLSVCQDPEPELSREAITSLGYIRDERALPTLIEKLNAPQSAIKVAVIDALGRFDRLAEAEDALLLLLDDFDAHIRQRAVRALAAIQGVKAVQYLPCMLEDADRDVCRETLSALTLEMKNDQLSERIFHLIFKFSGELRNDAAAALRRLDDHRVVPRIIDILHDGEQEEFHWMCIDALAELYDFQSFDNRNEEKNESIA